MIRTLENKITICFGAALIMLCVAVVVSVQSISHFIVDSRWDNHTYQVLSAISAVDAELKDAEGAGRGYVITGDEHFLGNWQAATDRIDPSLDSLSALTTDNRAQQLRIQILKPLIERKVGYFKTLVGFRHDHGFDGARPLLLTPDSVPLAETIRTMLSAMSAEENSLLTTRIPATEANARRSIALVTGGAISSLILVTLAVWLIYRSAAARTRAEVALSTRTTQLEAVDDELRLTSEQFQSFFTLSLDLLCIAGTDGYFKRLNPAWEKTLGFSERELCAVPFMDFVHSDDRAITAAFNADAAAGIQAGQFENRYRCKDGSYRWLMWKSAVSADLQLVYAAATDVTDRKRIEDEVAALNQTLQRQNLELESANKELEAFSYSVSHDLRAPLRSLDGFSQALLEDYSDKLDAQGQNYLGRIRTGSQRMGQLLDDLLNLSRVSRGELNRELVDLSKTAREVVEELRSAAPQRDAEFVVADGLIAETDPRLMRIVLTNLIENAWKFTAKTAHARIELGCSGENGGKEYFMRDNGAGFDPAYAGKLFGAFQRLHSTSDFPGTGIGLATVQRIVQRHGGRVWAEGIVGKGATFHFTLPELQKAAASPAAANLECRDVEFHLEATTLEAR